MRPVHRTVPWRLAAIGFAVGMAGSLSALAVVQEPGADRSGVDRLEVRRVAKQLERGLGTYDEPTVTRWLSRPMALFELPFRPGALPADQDAARTEALALRQSRRAYDGAPPTMPHSRNFVRSKTCLDCHAEGIRIGERYGPPISHPHLVQCMQCHVESRNLDLPPWGAAVESEFEGLNAPMGGSRAWEGAPPVVPHATFMRNDCLSCHGPKGYDGLRMDHPERLNCVQCHAVAASLDQGSPFFTGKATLVVPTPPDAP